MRIGRKVWQNECGGTVAGLTSWNAGENFASLGIGHFIWYPAGARGPFEESFPPFVRYVARRGAKLPEQLLGRKGEACPWNSRAEFLAAASSPKMKQLRIFLVDTIDLQADFLVERLHEALPKMLAATSDRETWAGRGAIQPSRRQRAGLLRADRLCELQGRRRAADRTLSGSWLGFAAGAGRHVDSERQVAHSRVRRIRGAGPARAGGERASRAE